MVLVKNSPLPSKSSLSAKSLFAIGGAVSEPLKGFEPRLQQIQMAQAVERSLVEGAPLLVEAGTGVGKSLAYLIPAALWAVRKQTGLGLHPYQSASRANSSQRSAHHPDGIKIAGG